MSDVLKMGLMLCLVVLLFILANVFYFVPLMTEEPEYYSTTQKNYPERPESDILIKDSLTDMKDLAAGPANPHISPSDADGRNPFFGREEKKEQVVVKEPVIPEKVEVREEVEKPQLSMVIVGVQSRKALLDDIFVSEGDMFYGYQVKRIGPDNVILADKFGELKIRLGVSEETGEVIPEPAGLIER